MKADVLAAKIDGPDDVDTIIAHLIPKVSPPITIVQLNACTLKAKTKKKFYLKQLRDDAVHVCGIEEQRGTFTGVTCSDGYILAHSAAEDGKGGCLLAFSATLDFAHTGGKSDLRLV